MKFINQEQLKAQAQGNWIDIVNSIVPSVVPATQKPGRHVSCPVHGGKDGFRVAKDFNHSGVAFSNQDGTFGNGFKLLSWLLKVSYREALELVDGYFNGVEYGSNVVDFKPVQKSSSFEFSKVLKLWSSGKTIQQGYLSGSVAFKATQAYFKSRGLNIGLVANQDVRLVDELIYGSDKNGAMIRCPGFICAVRNASGEIQTLHRFYLTEDGAKAAVDNPRKLMGIANHKSVSGASIQFGRPNDGILGIAEGLETALSVVAATGMSCWSAISAHGIESFEPSVGVHTVVVFADKDRSLTGARAATALKERLETSGIKVIRVFPKAEISEGSKSIDWNDVLVAGGSFPTFEAIKKNAA